MSKKIINEIVELIESFIETGNQTKIVLEPELAYRVAISLLSEGCEFDEDCQPNKELVQIAKNNNYPLAITLLEMDEIPIFFFEEVMYKNSTLYDDTVDMYIQKEYEELIDTREYCCLENISVFELDEIEEKLDKDNIIQTAMLKLKSGANVYEVLDDLVDEVLENLGDE